MFNPASPTLILAIPGTQDTQELPRKAVLEALKRGEIGPDHWVWSSSHNDWKPLAEIPELQVAPVAVPSFARKSEPAANQPGVARQMAPTKFSQPQEIHHDFPFFKVIFAIPCLAVVGILAANYFMVDKPFAGNLATTPFGSVQACAHLGAFVQPNALVIHILPTKEVNPDNFEDFLVALARSTPPQPLNQKPFDEVALTSSWQSQYIFDGADWEKLGQMDGASSDEKKKFELEHLEQRDGSPLVNILKRDDPATVTAREARAWQALVAHFLPRST